MIHTVYAPRCMVFCTHAREPLTAEVDMKGRLRITAKVALRDDTNATADACSRQIELNLKL
jgi:hypothetical protein